MDGIAQIRNTPRTDGISPAQVVFGRSIRTMLPTLTEALGTNQFVEKVRKRKTDFDLKQRIRFDKQAKDLKELARGTLIWLQNDEPRRWDEKGVVLEQTRPRTYKIQLQTGKFVYRNRKKIRKRTELAKDMITDGHKPKDDAWTISHEPDLEDGKIIAGKLRRSERIRKTTNT